MKVGGLRGVLGGFHAGKIPCTILAFIGVFRGVCAYERGLWDLKSVYSASARRLGFSGAFASPFYVDVE